MDRRGQVDKAFEALPVFFAVVVVLILFTLLSAGVFGFKKLSERDAEFSSVDMPILFENISMNNTPMSVIEAFLISVDGGYINETFKKQVLALTPDDGCLALLWLDNVPLQDYSGVAPTISDTPFGILSRGINGTVSEITYQLDSGRSFLRNYTAYKDKHALQTAKLSFTDSKKDFTFMTYRGRCLDG
jgi:hypothetical protein